METENDEKTDERQITQNLSQNNQKTPTAAKCHRPLDYPAWGTATTGMDSIYAMR